MLDSYVTAIRSLETFAFAGVSCQHGIPLADDCHDCEPLLDHYPGFGGGPHE